MRARVMAALASGALAAAGPLAVLGPLAGRAAAQAPAPASRAQTLDPTGSAARAPGGPAAIDESALRYYAATRQLARVEAETRRLERLHPGWSQPADLWSAEPGRPDEQPYWDLFAADRLDELQRLMQARKEAEPEWEPSQDLQGKLERKLLRGRILAEARRGDWVMVAALADSIDVDATRDPELFWTAGEGLMRAKRPADATRMFKAVMETSFDTPTRIATVQKALALFPIEEWEKLVALGRRTGDGGSELDPIATDITRARIVAYLRRQRAAEVPAAELARFAEPARAAPDAGDAKLLAWYYFQRDEQPEALEWFKHAIARAGDAMTAHGLAHALRRMRRFREVEEVSYAWRELLAQNAILFIDILENDLTAEIPPEISTDRLQRYAEVTTATQSGEGAQALAWYAHNKCQDDVALAWFERAVAWFPKEATVLGYAVLLRRRGRQREFIEAVNRYDGLFPSVVGLLFDVGESKPRPCDAAAAVARPATPARAAPASPYLDLGGSTAAAAPVRPGDPFRPAPAAGPAAYAGVPLPGAPYPGPAGIEPPKVKRSEFPVPVPPENPIRFPRVEGGPGDGTVWRREAYEPPLVARRVSGVTAMPYERYGFSLLPSYTGDDAPSPFAVSRMAAPAGTVWAEDFKAGRLQRQTGAPVEALRRFDTVRGPGPATYGATR